MKLIISHPNRTIFEGEVESVNLPGTIGKFSVLKDHAPMVSTLKAGIIKYQISDDATENLVKIRAGFVEIKRNIIRVCIE